MADKIYERFEMKL